MNVKFTDHAEMRLVQHKLDREQVIAVVLAPEQIVSLPDEPPIAQARFLIEGKQYLLRVPYRDEGDTRWVITAYSTSQVKRYWLKEG